MCYGGCCSAGRACMDKAWTIYYGDNGPCWNATLKLLHVSSPTESITHVVISFEIPLLTADINALGTLWLLEATKDSRPGENDKGSQRKQCNSASGVAGFCTF